jgi:hypothetical protein
MRVRIVGTDLPRLPGVTVGMQRGRDTVHAVDSAAASAVFEVEVDVRGDDFRGPYVHGRPGERFLYLVWERDGEMFGRAKLMLTPDLAAHDAVTGTLALTDARGGPLCAAVRPPVISWSAG